MTKLDPLCQGYDCERVDPKCAEDTAIKKWRETKKIQIRVLNTKVDFNAFDDEHMFR